MNKFIQDCFNGRKTAVTEKERKIIIDFINSQNKEVWLTIRDYEDLNISKYLVSKINTGALHKDIN